MNPRHGDSSSPQSGRRIPKGPLIIIVVVLATLAWVYWLTRTAPPRPAPELPPLRQLPLDSPPAQRPQASPDEG